MHLEEVNKELPGEIPDGIPRNIPEGMMENISNKEQEEIPGIVNHQEEFIKKSRKGSLNNTQEKILNKSFEKNPTRND